MNMSKTTGAIAFKKRKITEAFCQLNPFQPLLSVEHTSWKKLQLERPMQHLQQLVPELPPPMDLVPA